MSAPSPSPGAALPVFLYHRISERPGKGMTSRRVFCSHLDCLANGGWNSLKLEDFASIATGKRPLPRKSFLITFDDGYDCLPYVARELGARGFSGAAFLITGWLDGRACHISKDQLGELIASGGMELASHTHQHLNWLRQGSDFSAALRGDLTESLETLNQIQGGGGGTHYLAWPWGIASPQMNRIAREAGFRTLFTVANTPILNAVDAETVWPRICVENLRPASFSILLSILSSKLGAKILSGAHRWRQSLRTQQIASNLQ